MVKITKRALRWSWTNNQMGNPRLHHWLTAITLLALSTLNSQFSTAFAQTTAFTYQGRLSTNGSTANGSYDFTFSLFATNSGGGAIAGPVTNSATAVSNGLFTTAIDFGAGVFTGSDYWLQLTVRTNGGSGFTTLSPRQQITSTPYAIQSLNAANASSVAATNISGTVGLSQLPVNVITNNGSNVNISGTFSGDGSGLTNVSHSAYAFVYLNSPANGTIVTAGSAVPINTTGYLSGWTFNNSSFGLTASNAGVYLIHFECLTLNASSGPTIGVQVNGTPVAGGTVIAGSEAFSHSCIVSLHAGDVVQFVVPAGSSPVSLCDALASIGLTFSATIVRLN